MSRPCVLALGIAILVLNPVARVPAAPPEVARYVLPAGQRLIIRDDPDAQVVTLSLQIKSGSRYETPATAGLSHFVQRVMIRGTSKRSARQILEAVEDIGGSVDASGDVEHAEIRGGALAAHGHALLDLIAEVALSPTFPREEIERERRLISSQIQTRAETPFSLALETLTARLYGPHPLALPVLGHKASVERFSRDDLLHHYRRVYRAGSTVIAVSGRVDRDRIRRQAERLFAPMSPGRVDEPAPADASPAADRHVVDRSVQQAQIVVGFLGPGIGHPDYAPGKIMSAILGGGVAGRLFVTLRDDHGLAYSLGMLNPSRREAGSFVAYVATSDANAERGESGLLHEIERFRAEGPSEAEMARAKAYVLGSLAMDRRTNARHAWYLAFFELAGNGWDYPERHARALEAVTVADVMRVARRHLDRPTIVVVRPRS